MAHAPFPIHALFDIPTRRAPAHERLAPMLAEAHARERGARRLALRVRPRRRSRQPREARA